MSKTIDEKVVEMRFDNKNFENNVKTTMSTLDKLKARLDFKNASKSLEDLESASKKVKMNGLGDSVEMVKVKFNALHTIADQTLRNITNRAMAAGEQLIKSLSIDQISSGWAKYEQKTSNVQAILNATGKSIDEVNAYLDKLMWFSDETSYGFTDMTAALGQLTSAGGDIDKLIPMITGIANATAYSGKGVNEFSRAIYNLNQSYSAGELKYMDWKSLELAGVASKELKQVFIDTAKAMGKLGENGETVKGTIVDIATFGETLKDGWADTSVMEAAFGKFSELSEAAYEMVQNGEAETAREAIEKLSGQYSTVGEKAFKAAQEAKSFTEAIDATKDAVSSGWMKTFELIFGNYEEAKVIWSDLADSLWDIFASGAEKRNELVKDAMQTTNWKKLKNLIEDTGVSASDFSDVIATVAEEHGYAIEDLIEEYGSLDKAIEHGAIPANIIQKAFDKFANSLKGTQKVTANVTKDLEKFDKIVNKVINGDFGNGEARVKALTAAGWDYEEVQNLVNIKLKEGKITIDELSDSQLESIGYTDEQIAALRQLAKQAKNTNTPIGELIANLNKPSGRDLLIRSMQNILSGIQKTIGVVKRAWVEVFGETTSDSIYGVVEGIEKLTEKMDYSSETADKLVSAIKGIFSLSSLFSTFTGGVIKIFVKTLKGLFGLTTWDILDMLAAIGDALVAFRKWLFSSKLLEINLEKLGDVILESAKAATKWFISFKDLPWVQKNIQKFNEAMSTLVGILKNYFSKVGENFKKFFDYLKTMDVPSVENLADAFVLLVEAIKSIFEFDFGELVTKLSTFFQDVKKSYTKYFGKLIEFATRVREKLGNVIGFGEIFTIVSSLAMIKSLKVIGKALETLAGPFEAFTKIGKGVAKVLNELGGLLKAKTLETKTDALLKFAKAIGIIVVSLFILTKIPIDKLGYAALTITAITAALLGLTKLMDILNKGKGITKIGDLISGFAILSIATSMIILIGALKLMETLKIDGLQDRVNILSQLIIEFGLIIVAMGAFSKYSVKGTFAILAFAIGISILVKSLKNVVDMIASSGSNIDAASNIIMGFMFALATIIGAIGALKVDTFKMVGLLVLIVSIKLMLSLIQDIITLVNIEQIKANIWSFVGIFVALGVLIVASKFAGEYAAKAGIGILAMAAALVVMSLAIRKLSELMNDGTDIEGAITAILWILAMFGVLTAMSQFSGGNAAKAGLMILSMAAALLLIAGAIVVLSHIKDGLGQAVIALSIIIAMFALLVVASGQAGSGVEKTIVSFAIVIAALAASLAALSLIKDTNAMFSAAFAMVIVMAALALAIKATNGMNKDGTVKLLIVALMVSILGGIMYALSTLDSGAALQSAGAITLVLVALAGSLWVLGQVGDISLKALGAVIIMTAVIAALALILKMLSGTEVSWNSVGQLAVMVVILVGALGLLALLAGPLAALAPVLISIASAFAIFGVGALLIATAIFLICEAFIKLSETGGEVLENIPTIMAGIVSGIIVGLVQGLIDAVGVVLKTLWDVCVKIVEFVKNLLGIHSPSTVFADIGTNLIQGLINGIGGMAGALFSKIKELPSGAIDKIKEFLETFKITGSNIITNFKQGVSDKIESVITTVKQIPSDAISALREKIEEFKGIGKDLIDGLISGVQEKMQEVVDAAVNVVSSAVGAVKSFLGIASPSKLFTEIGRYSDEGLVKGLLGYSGRVADAGEEVGKSAVNSVYDAISKISDYVANGIDTEPTIRPVLDLSNVEVGTRRLSSMFSANQALSINASMNGNRNSTNQNGESGIQNGVNVNFYQTNNSPKALNRIEIYRQTKNQISSMKEVVNAL